MPRGDATPRLRTMTDTHSTLDRLEARLEYQSARIDAVTRTLEARGILTDSADVDVYAGVNDAFFDELVQIEDSPLARDTHGERDGCSPPRLHASIGLHVGTATGV
jgi:hypothetical protein